MKGVIYARYSSDNQREESIEGQLRENKAFAEKNGIEIIETYIDRAFSAKTDNRPEFQRMIKESARKSYDVVIVWKLDRFARNRYDSAKYKAILKKNNIKVVSATEAISEGADGIILEAVLEGMAEYYSADLAEKVTRGMTENALKCKYNGGMCVPFGYVSVRRRQCHASFFGATAQRCAESHSERFESDRKRRLHPIHKRGIGDAGDGGRRDQKAHRAGEDSASADDGEDASQLSQQIYAF